MLKLHWKDTRSSIAPVPTPLPRAVSPGCVGRGGPRPAGCQCCRASADKSTDRAAAAGKRIAPVEPLFRTSQTRALPCVSSSRPSSKLGGRAAADGVTALTGEGRVAPNPTPAVCTAAGSARASPWRLVTAAGIEPQCSSSPLTALSRSSNGPRERWWPPLALPWLAGVTVGRAGVLSDPPGLAVARGSGA